MERTAFACLLRALVRDWRVAALAAFALAFSGGFMMEIRAIRLRRSAGLNRRPVPLVIMRP